MGFAFVVIVNLVTQKMLHQIAILQQGQRIFNQATMIASSWHDSPPAVAGRIPTTRRMKNLLFLALFVVATGFASRPLMAQSPPGSARKTSTPYKGDLTIFDSAGREDRLQIERVMNILKIAPGSSVADIGAGSGWFTVRASKRVGAHGEVYAEDINPEAITYIQKRVAEEGLANVHTILGKSDNALLPAEKIDAVLLLKTYHEVAEPVTLLNYLRESLAPEARVGIIDRNGNGEDHGVAEKIVIAEAEQAGYKLLQRYDFVKADGMDYFLVFEINGFETK
jgi:ubiquinone/menaquinone biosynthesis C-methylase UbiE